MDEIIHLLKKYAMLVILLPLRLFPVCKNRVVVNNGLAKNYSGNPKAVAEYLCTVYPYKFNIIYPVRRPERFSFFEEKGIRAVKSYSLSAIYYAMTAAVFVTDGGDYSFLPLRKNQYVINTWHGGGAYKKGGRDVRKGKVVCADLRLAARKTDVFLSTCSRFTKAHSYALMMPKSIFWEIGMPRNDIMVNGDLRLRQTIRQRLGLTEGERMVLFAPTFRTFCENYANAASQYQAVSYGIDCERVCSALRTRFGGTWKFAFRFHPCVKNRGELPAGDVIDLSDYDDMQELLLAADVLINDFSSSMWDFMLTGKPCFIFALDLEEYIRTREVYTPVSEWPFPKAVDNDELEKNILSFNEDEYAASCEHHYKMLGGCETGKATKLVCERIYEYCFGATEAKQE